MTRLRTARRGFSLIECLVLIACASVLLGLTALLIRSTLELEQSDRKRLTASETVWRLGRSLRADARACVDRPKVEAAGVSLALADGGSVRYAVEPTRIVRTLRRVDKTTHYDVFTLPHRVSARFETRGEPPALAVVLDEAETPGRPRTGPYRDYAVEASLGRDSTLGGASK